MHYARIYKICKLSMVILSVISDILLILRCFFSSDVRFCVDSLSWRLSVNLLFFLYQNSKELGESNHTKFGSFHSTFRLENYCLLFHWNQPNQNILSTRFFTSLKSLKFSVTCICPFCNFAFFIRMLYIVNKSWKIKS